MVLIHDIPKPLPEVKSREIEEELLLYRDKDHPGFTLNSSAQSIWELCDGKRDVAAICADLGQRFGVPAAALKNDVQNALEQLLQAGVLKMQGFVRSSGLDGLDWSLVAEPRLDQYDTQAALAMVAARGTVDGHPYALRPPLADEPTLMAGSPALRYCYSKTAEDLRPAPLDHPNLAAAVEYLEAWPAAAEQLRWLVHSFHPVLVDGPADASAFLTGSRSHADESQFGTLWSSINCPLMLADNLVHEMGHIKLFALGIYKEGSDGLIFNSPDELYVSPVITDRGRPMSAVLHAVYAFAHVVELELRVLQTLEGKRHKKLQHRIGSSVEKLEQGRQEIETHARVDAAGEAFLGGLYRWLDRLALEGGTVGMA